MPIGTAFSVATRETLIDRVRFTAHPQLNFTVIVNPQSGPGPSRYPTDQYSLQVQQLNAYPNVRKVGYVRTGYATRNIISVLQEVSTYSGWASNSTALAMDGIFFDEVPSEYSPAMAEYLSSINQAVKNASGLQPDRTVRNQTRSRTIIAAFLQCISAPPSSSPLPSSISAGKWWSCFILTSSSDSLTPCNR